MEKSLLPPPPPHYPKPAPFFATTPEKRHEKQRENFRLMKLSMDRQKLQTWVIHLQGFNDRTVQNEMLFFFFVQKKKGHEVVKYPIQSKGKAKFVWDSTGCYNLFYLSSVEIHSCCTKYSNVDIFKFTHPSHDIRKAEVTVKNQTQEDNVSA